MKNQTKAKFLNGALVVACLGLALGCSTFKNLTGGQKTGSEFVPSMMPKAGQKLSGHYEHGSPAEIYTFNENGTYTYEDPENKDRSKESGTYQIDGEKIKMQANGNSVSKSIRISNDGVDKTSPQKINLDLTTFELTTAEQLASRKNDSASSNIALPTEVDFALPEDFEGFTRTGKIITLKNYSNYVEGCQDLPKSKISESSDYRAANGEIVNFEKAIFDTPANAKKYLNCWLKEDGSYDASSTKEEISHDLPRYQVAERVPTKNGGELLVMKTFPRYEQVDKAYLVEGNSFYRWIDSGSGAHKTHQTTVFAKTWVEQETATK